MRCFFAVVDNDVDDGIYAIDSFACGDTVVDVVFVPERNSVVGALLERRVESGDVFSRSAQAVDLNTEHQQCSASDNRMLVLVQRSPRSTTAGQTVNARHSRFSNGAISLVDTNGWRGPFADSPLANKTRQNSRGMPTSGAVSNITLHNLCSTAHVVCNEIYRNSYYNMPHLVRRQHAPRRLPHGLLRGAPFL